MRSIMGLEHLTTLHGFAKPQKLGTHLTDYPSHPNVFPQNSSRMHRHCQTPQLPIPKVYLNAVSSRAFEMVFVAKEPSSCRLSPRWWAYFKKNRPKQNSSGHGWILCMKPCRDLRCVSPKKIEGQQTPPHLTSVSHISRHPVAATPRL